MKIIKSCVGLTILGSGCNYSHVGSSIASSAGRAAALARLVVTQTGPLVCGCPPHLIPLSVAPTATKTSCSSRSAMIPPSTKTAGAIGSRDLRIHR